MGHLFFFFFNDTATTEIYTLSLHDALPILPAHRPQRPRSAQPRVLRPLDLAPDPVAVLAQGPGSGTQPAHRLQRPAPAQAPDGSAGTARRPPPGRDRKSVV